MKVTHSPAVRAHPGAEVGTVRRVEVVLEDRAGGDAVVTFRDLDDGSEHVAAVYRGQVGDGLAEGDRGRLVRMAGWAGDYWSFSREDGS